MRNRIAVFALTVLAVLAQPTAAAVLTVLVGDDDGFGGTQGTSSSPGESYSNMAAASLGAISPGNYANGNALDVNTADPWEPYVFTFDFAFDTSSLASVASAVVEIQHGSLARRTAIVAGNDGPGYGYAAVSADAGGPSLGLGDFLTIDTGGAGSSLEEIVKISTFDVTSLIAAGTSGTLSLTIDGAGIQANSPALFTNKNPVDLFAMDFARLTITDIPLPAPTPLALLGLGLAAVMGRRRRG